MSDCALCLCVCVLGRVWSDEHCHCAAGEWLHTQTLQTHTHNTHRAIADSLVFLTQRTAIDLQLVPFSDADTKSIPNDLPTKTVYGGLNNPNKVSVNVDYI